jgi:hypothetical protein
MNLPLLLDSFLPEPDTEMIDCGLDRSCPEEIVPDLPPLRFSFAGVCIWSFSSSDAKESAVV